MVAGSILASSSTDDSDQGVQYRCGGYIQVLRDHRMVASISRPGYPYNHASCESFMKTPKREEIYARDYRDLEHLLESVEGFIENGVNPNFETVFGGHASAISSGLPTMRTSSA